MMNYSNSETCILRSVKRRCTRDCLPDERMKVSRQSFSSRVNGLQSLQHQTPGDFSQLMECGDSDSDTSQTSLHNQCNDAYSLPMKKTISESLDSKGLLPVLSDQVSDFGKHNCSVLYNTHISADVNLVPSAVITMSEKSQQASEQLSVSRSFSMVQPIHNNIPPASDDHGCQKCAAGQPGHIQHIGQWRVMDSF